MYQTVAIYRPYLDPDSYKHKTKVYDSYRNWIVANWALAKTLMLKQYYSFRCDDNESMVVFKMDKMLCCTGLATK